MPRSAARSRVPSVRSQPACVTSASASDFDRPPERTMRSRMPSEAWNCVQRQRARLIVADVAQCRGAHSSRVHGRGRRHARALQRERATTGTRRSARERVRDERIRRAERSETRAARTGTSRGAAARRQPARCGCGTASQAASIGVGSSRVGVARLDGGRPPIRRRTRVPRCPRWFGPTQRCRPRQCDTIAERQRRIDAADG